MDWKSVMALDCGVTYWSGAGRINEALQFQTPADTFQQIVPTYGGRRSRQKSQCYRIAKYRVGKQFGIKVVAVDSSALLLESEIQAHMPYANAVMDLELGGFIDQPWDFLIDETELFAFSAAIIFNGPDIHSYQAFANEDPDTLLDDVAAFLLAESPESTMTPAHLRNTLSRYQRADWAQQEAQSSKLTLYFF